MLHYMAAISKFGITHTPRQERKWNRKRGVTYKLADKFSHLEAGGEDDVSAEAIELAKLDMSRPGPNPNKKEKRKRDGNRQSRKSSRNDNKRKEAQRQKTHKKNKWRRRKEMAA